MKYWELTCSLNHLGMLDISVDLEVKKKQTPCSTGKKRHWLLQFKKSCWFNASKYWIFLSYYSIMTHYTVNTQDLNFHKLSLKLCKSRRQSFDSVQQLLYLYVRQLAFYNRSQLQIIPISNVAPYPDKVVSI